MAYRDTVVEESKNRLQEILGKMKTLKAELRACESEYGQVVDVLRALKADHQIGIATEVQVKSISDADETVFEYSGKPYRLQNRTIERIRQLDGVVRSCRVVAEVAKEPDRHGRASSLASAANIYLAYMLQKGLAERVSHGKYRMKKPTTTDHPDPKMRDVVEEGTEPAYRVVDGVVTTEKPEERGYGR